MTCECAALRCDALLHVSCSDVFLAHIVCTARGSRTAAEIIMYVLAGPAASGLGLAPGSPLGSRHHFAIVPDGADCKSSLIRSSS